MRSIDLDARTLLVVSAKEDRTFRIAELGTSPLEYSDVRELRMGFVVPAGSEQVKVSKMAAKVKGAKDLRLEDLKPRAELRAEFYPARSAQLKVVAVRELILEQ